MRLSFSACDRKSIPLLLVMRSKSQTKVLEGKVVEDRLFTFSVCQLNSKIKLSETQ